MEPFALHIDAVSGGSAVFDESAESLSQLTSNEMYSPLVIYANLLILLIFTVYCHIVLFRRKRRGPPKTSLSITSPESATKYCRTCGKSVMKNAMACMDCGVPPRKGKEHCFHCGASMRSEAVICVVCGNQAPVASEMEPASLPGYLNKCFNRHYADFKGRARRKEFWGFCVLSVLIGLVVPTKNLIAAERALAPFEPVLVVGLLLSAAFLLPFWAVACRRFHDIGISGFAAMPIYAGTAAIFILSLISSLGVLAIRTTTSWWNVKYLRQQAQQESYPLLIAAFIIYAAISIYMLYFLTKNSETGTNEYGPNPKEQ